MHERHIMNDLMKKILAVAREHQAKRVTAIDVWLGALSHMTADHFREHFDLIAQGSIAEGAVLRCTVSDDLHHPQANGIILQDIEAED